MKSKTRFLKIKDVIAITRLSESSVYRAMESEKERFPRQIKIGPRSVVWDEAEIEEWMSKKLQSRA